MMSGLSFSLVAAEVRFSLVSIHTEPWWLGRRLGNQIEIVTAELDVPLLIV